MKRTTRRNKIEIMLKYRYLVVRQHTLATGWEKGEMASNIHGYFVGIFSNKLWALIAFKWFWYFRVTYLVLIIGRLYSCYEEACTLLSCEPLSDRRDTLCLKFIRKAVKRGQHKDIFIPATNNNMTRSKKLRLKEYTCNTQRFFNSPLVYLSRIHNKNLK